MRSVWLITLLLVVLPTACLAGVVVVVPADNTTVSSPTHFVAQASSVNGIASMTINVDSQDVYKINSSGLDTYVPLAPGTRRVLIKAWDNKGNYMDSALTLNVTSASGNAVTVTAPADGATVFSPVQFLASASSPNGIASMTVNVDSQDLYRVNSDHLDTTLSLATGTHRVFVKAWDNKGNYFDRTLTISVSGSGSASTGSPGITVSSPANNATVPSPAHFVAVASGSGGIASMTINIDSQDAFKINSDHLDTYIN
ncbi:MAG TPA: Ig-like domain-containing protein, partial [Terriglobales bacterium]|nr:Ig-like domain-containing protein [Terriglobales bacterium]